MKFNTYITLLSIVTFFGSSSVTAVEITQDIIDPIVQYKAKLSKEHKKLEQLEAKHKNVSDSLIILNSQLASKKDEKEDQKRQYNIYLDLARTDPDPVYINEVSAVGLQLKASKEAIATLDTSVTKANKSLVRLGVDIKIVKKSYNGLLDRENIQFNKSVTVLVKQQTDKFKRSKFVKGTAKEVCSRDEIISSCEKRARIIAEKNALEKGTTILINSSTTLKNFKLEEDVIKSQLQASLSDVVVQKSEVKTIKPLSFEVIISAKVNPKISDDLLEQFKQHSVQLLQKYRVDGGLANYQNQNSLVNVAPIVPLAVVDTAKVKKEVVKAEPVELTVQETVTISKYQQELDVVLNLIEQHYYFSPRRSNAYRKLEQINDPKEESVSRVYIQLKESAINQIDILTNQERLDDAEDLLDELESNYPMKREANELAKNIANKKQEIKNRKVINSYLADASNAIGRNRFFSPRRKNAFYYYQTVLNIDSNNQPANEALKKLPQKILQSIDNMVEDDDLGDAIDLAEKALDKFASDTTISFKLDELRRLEVAEKKKKKRSISIGW
jgi:hypothetical protein